MPSRGPFNQSRAGVRGPGPLALITAQKFHTRPLDGPRLHQQEEASWSDMIQANLSCPPDGSVSPLVQAKVKSMKASSVFLNPLMLEVILALSAEVRNLLMILTEV